MQPTFFRAPDFDEEVSGGIDTTELLPQAYLTADRKLLMIDWPWRSPTYHLPETWMSVRFNDVASAFHAAYGREMQE